MENHEFNPKLPVTNLNDLGDESSTRLLIFSPKTKPVLPTPPKHTRVLFEGQNASMLVISKLYIHFIMTDLQYSGY